MKRGQCLLAALVTVASAGPLQAAHPLEIAITIDDLPVHAPYPPGVTPLQVNRKMIAALKSAHVPATAFVNGINANDAETREALTEWRSAGFTLGNHTWSHPHLSQLTIAQFSKELTNNEPMLEALDGKSDWRWFRYPFLDEGKDESQRITARQLLASRGYRVAAVTMSFSDWAFTPAYARCAAAANTAGIAELQQLYLQSVRENIVSSRDQARKIYGRDIPYVLLMHVSALSAQMMPQVVALYRKYGFRLVSLARAESDPVYAAYTDLKLPPPLSTQELARQKHVSLDFAPDHSSRLDRICTAKAS